MYRDVPGTERNGFSMEIAARNGSARNGFRSGTEWNGSERNEFRSGTERFGTDRIAAKNQNFDPDPKNVVIPKLFAPKFCAECTGRELHSSHGDPFRENSKI